MTLLSSGSSNYRCLRTQPAKEEDLVFKEIEFDSDKGTYTSVIQDESSESNVESTVVVDADNEKILSVKSGRD